MSNRSDLSGMILPMARRVEAMQEPIYRTECVPDV